MIEVKNYYDLTDLVKEVAEKTETSVLDVEHILKAAFETLAERIGKAENPVVLDNVGTFIASPHRAKDWRFLRTDAEGNTTEQTGTTNARLKVRFKAAKKFAGVVKDNLPLSLANFDVK